MGILVCFPRYLKPSWVLRLFTTDSQNQKRSCKIMGGVYPKRLMDEDLQPTFALFITASVGINRKWQSAQPSVEISLLLWWKTFPQLVPNNFYLWTFPCCTSNFDFVIDHLSEFRFICCKAAVCFVTSSTLFCFNHCMITTNKPTWKQLIVFTETGSKSGLSTVRSMSQNWPGRSSNLTCQTNKQIIRIPEKILIFLNNFFKRSRHNTALSLIISHDLLLFIGITESTSSADVCVVCVCRWGALYRFWASHKTSSSRPENWWRPMMEAAGKETCTFWLKLLL